MQQEQGSENASNHEKGKDHQAKIDLIWSITGTAIAIWIFLIVLFSLLIFLPDYIPDRIDRAKVFLESMFSLAIVIVVVVHAVMYYKQAKEANRQAIASTQMIELMVLNECPYIRVGNLSVITPIQNHNLVVRGKFFNGGKTPAWNVQRQFQVQVAVDSEAIPFMGWDASPRESAVSMILANGDMGFETDPLKVTDETVANLITDRERVFIDGECRYFDQLGGKMTYTFGYTFEQNPSRVIERYQRHHREKTNPN